LGWNVRRRDAAGQWEWLCTDGKWRAEKNIPDSGYSLSLFENCAVIDKELVGVERKLFFVAKWK
jgi:hypothetical protein